ncbi:MAG: Bcr/CflA family multidrug efflux MFS transporter [Bryobacteraceae bacterium]
MPRWQRFELLILLGMLQAIAPVSIDMYLPAMPQLEQVFHASAAAVESTMVTFLIGFAFGQLLYGPITDRFGRKPPLYFSLVLFTISSAACAFVPSIGMMSLLRLFQALGACGGSVISRAMVRDLFPPSELRRVFSMLVLVLGVSPILAPMLGSYLLLWFGWQSAFLAQATVGVLCFLGMHFRLRESMSDEQRRPLHLGTIISSYATLIKDRTFMGASAVCGFSSAGAFAYIASASFVFISQYKVAIEHFGWLFGSVAAGMVAASQINGRMSSHIPLWKVLRGANLVQLAAAILLLSSVLSGIGGLPVVFFSIFIYIACQGFVFPNGSTIAMMRHAEMAGTASALLGTTQFLIAAVGTAFLGSLDNPAIPMALVILTCAVISTALNFLTLGPRLDAPR